MVSSSAPLHVPDHPVRVVTAASLFDGHDASISIMRRILQSQGCEVIHLGHDRSVADVVAAAIQEDAHAVAVSSYQGGHVEYYSYLREMLDARGATDIRVYGGGGGVIVPDEIALLAERGVRIFSPHDGQHLGLPAMVNTIVAESDRVLDDPGLTVQHLLDGDDTALARALTLLESGRAAAALTEGLTQAAAGQRVPVLGVTGTGGSGKSSLTDELLRRLNLDSDGAASVAVLAIDPSRRTGGGALLGDRIRMNSLRTRGEARPHFMRSIATRNATGLPAHLPDLIAACALTHDLVIVETPGIGQGDSSVADLADVSLYVMTPEYGAASQLEKIAMLEAADAVAINKFERLGTGAGSDARRDVARQLVRDRNAFGQSWHDMPVYGTSAARFGDDGVTALYHHLRELLGDKGLDVPSGRLPRASEAERTKEPTQLSSTVPADRKRHLAEVASTVRGHHATTRDLADAARHRQHLATAADLLAGSTSEPGAPEQTALDALREAAEGALPSDLRTALDEWPQTRERYAGPEVSYEVRGREVRTAARRTTLSGTEIPRVALPRTSDHGDLVTYLRSENLPGSFPFTAGVFPFKRDAEAPTRMFAGEGDPARTNRRFHLLSQGQSAVRLSTAFDSVTLYGRDPATQPDIYGKVGTSGVSIATLDDMRDLFTGFDLIDPATSVSMTINGPAPTILAMFLNAAIDQQVETFVADQGRQPDSSEHQQLRARVLSSVRGTVQADILKEDQGQNTCIFSTEFSLRCMGDMQQFFIDERVRNFYSVSISGYHIAEAGANPISQLAFTLANAFTYVETYLARGMAVDEFAPNLSFFFSNGMDAEYTVLGRVARRIWAIAMRDLYGGDERSQKLKYHVQTSGRSLHAQEMSFNDIRTTLQALCAIYDHANSLHTNAYDEAVTTPTAASVRRALAIQMIIDAEWGLASCENPLQGSYVVDELTDLVEEAVLTEFERLADRGGVLGAMETGYQRGRIQDESMLYEQRKHDGSLPIIGVNTFLDPDAAEAVHGPLELARATEHEKRSQIERLEGFHARHADEAPAALEALKRTASEGGNTFAALMEAVRVCSLGQITEAFFEVGGQYRRAM